MRNSRERRANWAGVRSAKRPATGSVAAIRELSVLPPRPAFAGFWLRAVAYLIDTVLISLFFILIASFYPSTFLNFLPPGPTSLTSMPQLTPIVFAHTYGTWFLLHGF